MKEANLKKICNRNVNKTGILTKLSTVYHLLKLCFYCLNILLLHNSQNDIKYNYCQFLFDNSINKQEVRQI